MLVVTPLAELAEQKSVVTSMAGFGALQSGVNEFSWFDQENRWPFEWRCGQLRVTPSPVMSCFSSAVTERRS